MNTLRQLLELAKKTGKSLKEIFANVPGSYSTYRKEIASLLKTNPPDVLGAHRWAYVEEIIGDYPESVIVECAKATDSGSYEYKYYQIAVQLDEEGNPTWGEGKEVEFDVVITTKNEAAALNEQFGSGQVQQIQLEENKIGKVTIDEATKKASVQIAQRAEVKNRNNRVYPAAVLKAAVEQAKTRLPLPMETMHRPEQNIGDTCALIKDIQYDEDTGIVSLPEIEIFNAGSGKVIQEYIEKGGKLEVSQRAVGSSIQVTDEKTGETYDLITSLHITGWDMVGDGSASVAGTSFALESFLEAGGTPTPTPTPTPNPTPTPTPNPGQLPANVNLEDLVGQAVSKALNPYQEGLTTAQQQMLDETRNSQLSRYRVLAVDAIDDILAETPRFSLQQKEVIKARINIDEHFDKISMDDLTSISRVLKPVVQTEMEFTDKLIAGQARDAWNLPAAQGGMGADRLINNAGGMTYSQMLNVAPIDIPLYNETVQKAINEINRQNPNLWVMPENHPQMDVLAKVMNSFFEKNGNALKEEQRALNETNQSDIKVPVNLTSMYMVAVAWRLTTAFEFAQLHPMVNLLENIPVQVWNGQQASTTPAIERWEKYHTAEDTNIPVSEIRYLNSELAASYQSLHLKITPHARATARGSVMDPIMDSLANGAREIRDLTDTMIWDLTIVEALKHNATQVTTAADCTEVSGQTRTWKIPAPANSVLVDYEWVVQKNDDGNVSKTLFRRLTPDTGSATLDHDGSLTPVIITDSGATQPTNGFIYGTDWTIDWDNQWIILTAAGETKRGSDTIKATYTYNNKNVKVFDAKPPAGTTFLGNLINLRLRLAEARTLITDEHYMPECLAWNYGIKEKVALGAQFTHDGGSEANALNMMNEILRFDGTKTVWSTAIRQQWIINAQMMSTLYGLHTPFSLSSEQRTDEQGNRRYFGEQWSGGKVPKPEKSALVYIKNVDNFGDSTPSA